MNPSLTIEYEHPKYRIDEKVLRRLIEHTVDQEGFRIQELTVVLGSHDLVLDLNRTYLQHDYITDVLSFDLSESTDDRLIEGEIYVDVDTASERFEEFQTTLDEEIKRYVVHGLLHLMGYDDSTPEGKRHMHELEDRYLAEVS